MRMFSAATMRGLVAGLLILGIVFGLVLSQVVPPVVAGVGVGAREVANRVATLGAKPAAAQLAPAQPAQIHFNQVAWPDIVEKVGPAVVTVVSETAAPRTPR